MFPLTKKNIAISLLITLVFNSLFALVMSYIVLEKDEIFDVFVVTQLIGLSIYGFAAAGRRFFPGRDATRTAVVVFVGIILGVLFGAAMSWGYMVLRYDTDFAHFFSRVFIYIAVFGFVFGVPVLYFYSSWHRMRESEKLIQRQKIERLTMEKQAAMTTLRLLQAQIEPHFLFNTLSNVSTLLDSDVDKGKQMLMDLNEYLRISLQRTRQEMITLAQELDLVRRYLDIFKIRMGARLSYAIEDRTGRDQIPFPPLILQPLVENSIKYGLSPKVDGGEISVDCHIDRERLVIRVADTGVGLDRSADQAGVGIDNVVRRLATLYGPEASLVLKENRPQGLEATVEVPL